MNNLLQILSLSAMVLLGHCSLTPPSPCVNNGKLCQYFFNIAIKPSYNLCEETAFQSLCCKFCADKAPCVDTGEKDYCNKISDSPGLCNDMAFRSKCCKSCSEIDCADSGDPEYCLYHYNDAMKASNDLCQTSERFRSNCCQTCYKPCVDKAQYCQEAYQEVVVKSHGQINLCNGDYFRSQCCMTCVDPYCADTVQTCEKEYSYLLTGSIDMCQVNENFRSTRCCKFCALKAQKKITG